MARVAVIHRVVGRVVGQVVVVTLVVVTVLAAHGVGDDMEHAPMLMVADAVQRMKRQVQGEHGSGQQKMAHPMGTQCTLSTPHSHHGIGTTSAVFARVATPSARHESQPVTELLDALLAHRLVITP